MGVHILHDRRADLAALYCSTTDVAFGPVFNDSDDHDADERAEAFLRWLKVDPRHFSDSILQDKYGEWLIQEDAQWATEDAALFAEDD